MGYIAHGERSENLILKVPKNLTDEGCKDWVTTLVGYFIGKGLPYSLVSATTDRIWADYGLFDTLATDSGVYFFTFSCEEKRDAVLEGGPWYVAGQPLILQQWKPSLRLDTKNANSIPIWVNLYGIPLELWNPKGISFIASYIGKPLRVDRMTASRRRITYARVCVEVSGDKELIDKFAIETDSGNGGTTLLDIEVEYQWKPSRCSICSTFGHDCNKGATQGHGRAASRPIPSPSRPTSNRHRSPPAKAGVWQVVQKKDHGKNTIQDLVSTSSPHVFEVADRCSSQEKQVTEKDTYLSPVGYAASPVEHIVHSISDFPPLCEYRTSTVPTNNSFNGLIPYVYNCEDTVLQDDNGGESPNEAVLEQDYTSESFSDTKVQVASPISARQRKKEAKMLFSGSRPKGRHR